MPSAGPCHTALRRVRVAPAVLVVLLALLTLPGLATAAPGLGAGGPLPLHYAELYPGVRLVFYGTERELEYDLVVAPGADPGAVELAFDGADSLRLDARGDLVIATAASDLRLRRSNFRVNILTDVAGAVQFSAAAFSVSQCATSPCEAVLSVSRSCTGATVDFVTVDGTATALSDYVATTGQIHFNAGQLGTTIRIPLQIEPGAQPLKTLGVILTNPRGGATLGARSSAEVRITDTR